MSGVKRRNERGYDRVTVKRRMTIIGAVITIFLFVFIFFFNGTATTEIYTLTLHDALPI